jgi:hypothetical protein
MSKSWQKTHHCFRTNEPTWRISLSYFRSYRPIRLANLGKSPKRRSKLKEMALLGPATSQLSLPYFHRTRSCRIITGCLTDFDINQICLRTACNVLESLILSHHSLNQVLPGFQHQEPKGPNRFESLTIL